MNAIEHGLLGIGHDRKEEYLLEDSLDSEIQKGLDDPENQNKTVDVSFERCNSDLLVNIQDPGDGFDYTKFMTVEIDRIFDLHGRGIAIASMIFGEGIKYIGKGNAVEIRIPFE